MGESIIACRPIDHTCLRHHCRSEPLMVYQGFGLADGTSIGSDIHRGYRTSHQLPFRQIEGGLVRLTMQEKTEMLIGLRDIQVELQRLTTCHEGDLRYLMKGCP